MKLSLVFRLLKRIWMLKILKVKKKVKEKEVHFHHHQFLYYLGLETRIVNEKEIGVKEIVNAKKIETGKYLVKSYRGKKFLTTVLIIRY